MVIFSILASVLKQRTLGGLIVTQTRSIFVAVSSNTGNVGGLASKFALSKQPVTTVSCVTGFPCAVLDHPAIATFGNKAGSRVLACWAEFSGGTSVVKTSVSPDGNTWSPPQVLSSGRLCTVGGTSTQAVTWFNDQTNALFWATSSDGKTFIDKDNKSWGVSNPEALKGHEGHEVTVKAHEDAAKNEIHVVSVKMGKGEM